MSIREKGMTLVELLVVISLIGIISGVTWINFGEFGRFFNTDRDINIMAQDARGMLERAMAMEEFVFPQGYSSEHYTIAHGIRFQKGNEYYKNIYVINKDESSASFGDIVKVEQIDISKLEHGTISSIRVESGGPASSVEQIDVIFVPPHPRTYIGSIVVYEVGEAKKWQSAHDSVQIEVSLGDKEMRPVKITKSGLIEIIEPAS